MSLKRFYFPGFVFLGLLCFGLQAHQAHAAILLQGINTGHGAVTLSTSTNAGEFIVVEWAMSEGAFAVPTISGWEVQKVSRVADCDKQERQGKRLLSRVSKSEAR